MHVLRTTACNVYVTIFMNTNLIIKREKHNFHFIINQGEIFLWNLFEIQLIKRKPAIADKYWISNKVRRIRRPVRKSCDEFSTKKSRERQFMVISLGRFLPKLRLTRSRFIKAGQPNSTKNVALHLLIIETFENQHAFEQIIC